MTDVLTNVNPVVAPLPGLCLLLGYGNYYAIPRAYRAAKRRECMQLRSSQQDNKIFIVTKNKHQLNSCRNNADHADVLHGTLVHFCSQVWDGYSLLNTQKVVHSLTNRAECLHCNQSEKLSQQPTPQACAWKKTKSSSGFLDLGEYLQTLRKLHTVLKRRWDGCFIISHCPFFSTPTIGGCNL